MASHSIGYKFGETLKPLTLKVLIKGETIDKAAEFPNCICKRNSNGEVECICSTDSDSESQGHEKSYNSRSSTKTYDEGVDSEDQQEGIPEQTSQKENLIRRNQSSKKSKQKKSNRKQKECDMECDDDDDENTRVAQVSIKDLKSQHWITVFLSSGCDSLLNKKARMIKDKYLWLNGAYTVLGLYVFIGSLDSEVFGQSGVPLRRALIFISILFTITTILLGISAACIEKCDKKCCQNISNQMRRYESFMYLVALFIFLWMSLSRLIWIFWYIRQSSTSFVISEYLDAIETTSNVWTTAESVVLREYSIAMWYIRGWGVTTLVYIGACWYHSNTSNQEIIIK